MKNIYRAVHLAAFTMLLSLLASCGSNVNPLEVRIERCPALAVVGGTGSFTRFAGEGREARDVLFEAAISNLRLECDQGSDVVSDISFNVIVNRGPAMGPRAELVLPYYVVVMRDNSEIVAKEIFDTRLSFTADTDRVARREFLRQKLPTIEQARRYDYEILIGFQLSDDELVYNLLR